MNATTLTQCPLPVNWWRWLWQSIAFLGAYLLFAGLGAAASVFALALGFIWRGRNAQKFGQRFIHRLFAFFVWYVRMCRLVVLDAHELQELRASRGLIIASNHPCLLDVVFIVSQLPEVFCLMKASLVDNIVLSGTSKLAGYINNESGRGLVTQCQEMISAGGNLLVFPEGTRTAGDGVNPFKMGFALIAKLSGAPVQTVFIRADTNFLGKGWPFFRQPAFPIHYSVRLGRRFEPAPDMNVKKFGQQIEHYFRDAVTGRPHAAPLLAHDR